ncbi:MAG TPA: hypothetical protein PLX35_17265 [Cyclobacteriaceae bacterium]|nr:hypothetical protein [Cyclobacteriaceae bacterium]
MFRGPVYKICWNSVDKAGRVFEYGVYGGLVIRQHTLVQKLNFMRPCALVLVSFLYLSLLSCSVEQKKNQDIILVQTIDSVLSYVSREFNVKSEYTLIHVEIYPDNVKMLVLTRVVNSELNDKRRQLVSKLVESLGDSVSFRFDNYVFENVRVMDEIPGDTAQFLDPKLLATISISNSASLGDEGCYYFSINCGNQCSAGYLIQCRLENNKWKVDEIIQVWG